MPATLLAHNVQPYADLEAMLATLHKAMVVAATGAGKTSVTVKYLEDHNLRGLVVCPKISICKQWDTVSENIVTMTYQKFCNGPDISAYDCYIFDEAHHTGASKWGKAVKGLMASTDKPVIGLTADLKRYLDGGRDMGQELWDGNVVHGVALDEAISERYERTASTLMVRCLLFLCAKIIYWSGISIYKLSMQPNIQQDHKSLYGLQ